MVDADTYNVTMARGTLLKGMGVVPMITKSGGVLASNWAPDRRPALPSVQWAVALAVDLRPTRSSDCRCVDQLESSFGVRGRWIGSTFIGIVKDRPKQTVNDRAHQAARALQAGAPHAAIGVSRPLPTTVWDKAAAEARRASIYSLTTPEKLPRTIHDFPVEELLARDPTALARAAARIEPIAADDELILTLTVFYGLDGNREKSANALIVHLRTLDYRLQRIQRETGLRPRSLYGSRVLRTALIARELLCQHRRAGRAGRAYLAYLTD